MCPIPCPHPQLPLRFATKERDGLLLYNGRFNEKHDFVALEVIQEQVQLTFSAGDLLALRPCLSPRGSCPLAPVPKSYTLLAKPGPSAEHEHTLPSPGPHLVSQLTWVLSPGESTTTVSPFVPGGVSDGQWHTVQLKYYNKVSCGRGSRSWRVLSLAQVLTQTWTALPPRGPVMALLSEREGSGGRLPPCWGISIPLGSARYSLFH